MKKRKIIIIIVALIVIMLTGLKIYQYKHRVTKSTFMPTYSELTENGYEKDNDILELDNFKDIIKDTNIKPKVAYVKTTNKKSFKKIQLVTGTQTVPLGYMSAKIDNEGVDLGEISQPVNIKEIASKLSEAKFEIEIFAGDKVKIKGHDKQNSYIKYNFKLKDFAQGKLDFKAIYDLNCYKGSIDISQDTQDLSKYKVVCPENSSTSSMKKEITSVILNG